MFTGIIEGLGTITAVQPSGQGCRLTIRADFDLDRVKLGDSIAVNGACLTAVVLEGREFTVDVSPETVVRSTFSDIRIGMRVNLERALRLGDRLDGHLVSGHVDGTGRLRDRKTRSNAIILTFGVSRTLSRYMIEKGSVAVDGVSLTINRCDSESFDVSIIPHTASLTTVGLKRPGEAVNIETDMIGKYVEQFVLKGRVEESKPAESVIDTAFLARNGFL